MANQKVTTADGGSEEITPGGQPVAGTYVAGTGNSNPVSTPASGSSSASTPAATTSTALPRVAPTAPPSSVQGGSQNLDPNGVDYTDQNKKLDDPNYVPPDFKSTPTLGDYETADYQKLIGQSSEYLDAINQSATQAENEAGIAARGLAAGTGTGGSPSAETMKAGDIAKIETQRKVDIGNALQTIQTNADTMANKQGFSSVRASPPTGT